MRLLLPFFHSLCSKRFKNKRIMLKRKFDDIDTKDIPDKQLKNSLDSDEEDDDVNEDAYNVMNEDELEGI